MEQPDPSRSIDAAAAGDYFAEQERLVGTGKTLLCQIPQEIAGYPDVYLFPLPRQQRTNRFVGKLKDVGKLIERDCVPLKDDPSAAHVESRFRCAQHFLSMRHPRDPRQGMCWLVGIH